MHTSGTIASLIRSASARHVDLSPSLGSDLALRFEDAVDSLLRTVESGTSSPCRAAIAGRSAGDSHTAVEEMVADMNCLRADTPTQHELPQLASLLGLAPALRALTRLRRAVFDLGCMTRQAQCDGVASIGVLIKAWTQVGQYADALNSICSRPGGRESPAKYLFETVAVDALRREAADTLAESVKAQRILARVARIIEEIFETDPDELSSLLVEAKRVSDFDPVDLKLYFPPWATMLKLAERRVEEADEQIDALQERAVGVMHVSTLRAIVADAERLRIRGARIAWIGRVLNELEIADRATPDDVMAFWPMRRNIGTSWDHRPRRVMKSVLTEKLSRPVDELTSRLAKAARVRDFISLTNSPIRQAVVVPPYTGDFAEVSNGKSGVLLEHPLRTSFENGKETPRKRRSNIY